MMQISGFRLSIPEEIFPLWEMLFEQLVERKLKSASYSFEIESRSGKKVALRAVVEDKFARYFYSIDDGRYKNISEDWNEPYDWMKERLMR